MSTNATPAPTTQSSAERFVEATFDEKAGGFFVSLTNRATGQKDHLARVTMDADGDITRNQAAQLGIILAADALAATADRLADAYAKEDRGAGIRMLGNEHKTIAVIRAASALIKGEKPSSELHAAIKQRERFREFDALRKLNATQRQAGGVSIFLPFEVKADNVFDATPYRVLQIEESARQNPELAPECDKLLRSAEAAPYLVAGIFSLVESAQTQRNVYPYEEGLPMEHGFVEEAELAKKCLHADIFKGLGHGYSPQSALPRMAAQRHEAASLLADTLHQQKDLDPALRGKISAWLNDMMPDPANPILTAEEIEDSKALAPVKAGEKVSVTAPAAIQEI